MTEWLCVIVTLFAWVHGFTLAWAANNQHKPFWRGFLDALAFRWRPRP